MILGALFLLTLFCSLFAILGVVRVRGDVRSLSRGTYGRRVMRRWMWRGIRRTFR